MVAWHADPVVQEMWANVFKREHHQVIELQRGLGQWAVTVVRGASIKRLYAELPGLIASISEAGSLELVIYGSWPRGEVADTARRLGVERIAQVDRREPARAVFFIGGEGGLVPSEPDVITDWIDKMLADEDYHDTTAKLLSLEADERHVFLMSGDRTPFGADERLRRLVEGLPTRFPKVPAGITHVWVVSRFGDGRAGLWGANTGWSTVSLPG